LEEVSATGGWFAGTDRPTSADFVIAFTLEMFARVCPELLGPRTREYIKKIESR